jgi:hypothetical protein
MVQEQADDGYDYGKYMTKQMVKVTPICYFRYEPHYHCTAQEHEQDECMYFQSDIDGGCVHASGNDYVICERRQN